MPKFIIPLVAALLLGSACCHHKKPCAQPYCPPTAPTRPICPPAAQKSPCGCKANKHARRHSCPQQKSPRAATTLNRHAVSLSEVMDYLPGLPPLYLSI